MVSYMNALRLTWQKAMLKLGNGLLRKVARAQEIGGGIFRIEVPILVKDGSHTEGQDSQSEMCTLGRYDFREDIIKIYPKRILAACERYNLDLENLLIHPISHELGHAKETRLFEESGLFPFRFNMHPDSFVELDSHFYWLDSLRVMGRDLHRVFMLGIQDYCIERELHKHGIRDWMSKLRFLNIRDLQNVVDMPIHRHRLMVHALSLLPFDICHFVHGRLDQDERLVIEDHYRNLVGDKWDFALETMDELDFGNAKKYVHVVGKLFRHILGLKVSTVQNYRTLIFQDYKHIPRFWNRMRYRVFFLHPSIETVQSLKKQQGKLEHGYL